MGKIGYTTISDTIEIVLSQDSAREYPWHFHAEHWVSGKVETGEAFIETGRGKKTLAPGSTFRIAPLVPHKLCIAEGGSVSAVCIPGSSASSFTGALSSLLPLPEGLDWVLAPATVNASPKHLPGDRADAVEAVMRRIISAPEEPYALEKMAALSGYSLWHFLRLFRETAGMTPHAFQRICRLRLAREYIRSGMAAASAAAASGFTDQSHLHKVFKLHHDGLTPNLFAKACTTGPY